MKAKSRREIPPTRPHRLYQVCNLVKTSVCVTLYCNNSRTHSSNQRRGEGNDQESIRSSTPPDPEHYMGRRQTQDNTTHKRAIGSAFTSRRPQVCKSSLDDEKHKHF